MTLVGVIVFIPVAVFGRRFSLSSSAKECILHITIPSFACGALLATAVYLLIPESFALLAAAGADHSGHDHRVLQDDHEEHGDAWKAGTAILGGYFLPYLMQAFFPHPHVPGDIAVHTTDDRDDANQLDSKKDSSDTDGDEEVKVTVHENMDHIITAEEDPVKDDDTPAITKIASIPDYSLAVSILAGDFFHNFCDGIFIGTAFLLCSRDVAITVTATTVFHELSQELADFFLLTGECHFPIWKALLLNFISGLSVVLGVIVIFASDVNDTTIAILLAMSAGVYLFIALTECAPRVNSYVTSLRRRLLSFLFWVLGAVPIGLVLLNHNHCD
jgi:zinc transporter ZupT